METVENKVSGVPSWTPEQEARIAQLQSTTGCSRSEAVRQMRTEEKKAAKPAQAQVVTAAQLADQQSELDAGINKELIGNRVTVYEPGTKPARKARAKSAPKAKAQAKPQRKAGDSAEAHLSPQKMTAINELVRKEIGKGRAVEGIFKSSLNEKYTRYIWFGIDNGTVLSVNPDEMTTRWLDADSRSVKNWQKAQRAAVKREEKAAAKEGK